MKRTIWTLAMAMLAAMLLTACGGPDRKQAATEEKALQQLLDDYEKILDTHAAKIAAAATAEDLTAAKADLVKAVEEWAGKWGMQLNRTANLTEEQLNVLRQRALALKDKAATVLASELKDAAKAIEPPAAPAPDKPAPPPPPAE